MDTVVTRNYVEGLVNDSKKWEHHCPRCGGVFDRLLAISRYADVAICDSCGTDEALSAFIGDPISLKDWAVYKDGD